MHDYTLMLNRILKYAHIWSYRKLQLDYHLEFQPVMTVWHFHMFQPVSSYTDGPKQHPQSRLWPGNADHDLTDTSCRFWAPSRLYRRVSMTLRQSIQGSHQFKGTTWMQSYAVRFWHRRHTDLVRIRVARETGILPNPIAMVMNHSFQFNGTTCRNSAGSSH